MIITMDTMVHMNKKFGMVAVLIALVICGGTLYYLKSTKDSKPVVRDHEDSYDYRMIKVDNKEYVYNSDLIGILLLGIDSSDSKSLGQSDFINVMLLDRGSKTMKFLSISRDTMTPIQLFDASGNDLGWDKQHLALAYAYGKDPENGSMLSSAAVSKLLNDIPIVNFVTTDISSIADFQDIVGNLTVTIPDDSLSYLNIGWDKGMEVTLNKGNAEKFLRSRNTKVSFTNESRRVRQKVYMQAYVDKLKKMLSDDFSATVKKLASAYSKVTTNLSINDLDAYAEMLMRYSLDEDSFSNLKGEEKQGAFHDEYQIDENAKDALILQLFYKER